MENIKIDKTLVLEHLKDREWTQKRLAEELGVTAHTLQHRWHKGWPYQAAFLLASILNVKIKELEER